ncbi:MAG: histidinol dehydrogenase [Bacteroidales bacterium]|jgi:histidinol dehydrogenase|nr:histidinol dehydrogenase [Bacteroidales bacterium]
MKSVIFPAEEKWNELCKRPQMNQTDLDVVVRGILRQVREEGDEALLRLSEKYDGTCFRNLKLPSSSFEKALRLVPDDLKEAIKTASGNIRKFHSIQIREEPVVETTEGVRCWRRNVPIGRVGLYIPGGTAPLFSTVLMLAIPAIIAGCREVILCTPPDRTGNVNPVILYAAYSCGITEVYRIGGAQAVAAMAYGTQSIPRVDKIFGPGNQYVTKAKELVQLEGTAIDMPAGPSEVLIIADSSADPSFVAADLLSQAEHGPDSQVVLVTDAPGFHEAVMSEAERQAASLPRRDIAEKSLSNSLIILLRSAEECIRFSNMYAPEHLIISTSDPDLLAAEVVNAGSVFIGRFSCESAGDYASGTNHTLPTGGWARNTAGLSVESFIKKITFQEISARGIKNIGPVVERMAEEESLMGHKNAVTVRLKSLENDEN